MIELRTAEQLSRATKRAKAGRLFVRRTSIFRQYQVTNRENGNTYTVDFFVRRDGKRFGHCTCLGGQNGMVCKHLSAAAALHLYIAAQRAAA